MTFIIWVYGTLAGLVVAAPMLWGMLTMTEAAVPDNAALIGYLTMLVALTTVFLGIKHYRDKVLGGVIRFGPALVVGLGISAVASLFWAIGWEISLALTGFDFPEAYTNATLETARARGASEAELQQMIADGDAFARTYANPIIRFSISFIEMFPIGVLVSLGSAGLLRNHRFLPARTL